MIKVHARLRARRLRIEQEGDEGFTLIELLVVLLIIGILLAIAIPTFLSVTKSANNTAAQSNLQTGFTGAKTYFEQANQTYTGLLSNTTTASNITQVDTGLSFVTKGTNSSASNIVSVNGAGTYVQMAAYSAPTKDCWGILDITATQTGAVWSETAIGTYFAVWKNASAASCTASQGAPSAGNIKTSGFPAG